MFTYSQSKVLSKERLALRNEKCDFDWLTKKKLRVECLMKPNISAKLAVQTIKFMNERPKTTTSELLVRKKAVQRTVK